MPLYNFDPLGLPPYVSGRYYHPDGQGPVETGSAIGAPSFFSFCPGLIRSPVKIDRLGAQISTLSAGGNLQIALYRHHPTSGKPSTLVGNTANITTAATGPIDAVLAQGNQVLAPGLYWWGVAMDNTTAVVTSQGTISLSMCAMIGMPTAADIANVPNHLFITGQTFGAWSADYSGSSVIFAGSGRGPRVYFRAA